MKYSTKNIKFKKRHSVREVEEGLSLAPKFNENGLIPCITIEKKTKEVLMFSFLNSLALKKTIITKKAHYFSRSRKKIWLKGEVSGMSQSISNIFVDDDQDCIIYEVTLNKPKLKGKPASCHVGYKSCFYRKLKLDQENIALEFTEKKKMFDPDIVYKGESNPTKL